MEFLVSHVNYRKEKKIEMPKTASKTSENKSLFGFSEPFGLKTLSHGGLSHPILFILSAQHFSYYNTCLELSEIT